MKDPAQDDRAAWGLAAFGLIAGCWFAYYPLPFPEFYKEWIFATALGLAALVLRPSVLVRSLWRHPLAIAAAVILVALLIQSVVREGSWPRATLAACYVGFFVFALSVGRRMNAAAPERSLLWLCWCVLAAALGSCLFAALQLNRIEFAVPLVAPRAVGGRITGNLAQANHLADLLWLGCIACTYAHAKGKLSTSVACLAILVIEVFAHLTGSRMVWAYAAFTFVFAAFLRAYGQDVEVKRMATGLLYVGGLLVPVAISVSMSGMQELFQVSSGAERIVSASGSESDGLRFWLWRVGIDAIQGQPLLGLGVGRYVGHGYARTMEVAGSPTAGADAHAHNLFIHLGAELGVPVMIAVLICLGVWLVRSLRLARRNVNAMAAVALAGAILIHANLEYPLWYIYFLGLLGLFVGHVGSKDEATAKPIGSGGRWRAHLQRAAAIAVVGVAMASYAQFRHLETAMQSIVAQVGMGAAPQRDQVLEASVAALPAWSPYRDYAESIMLMTALPTKENARDLSARCERAVAWGPTPYLLSRCATAFQVAGLSERASYFANGVCKIFPDRDLVLIESMNYVQRTSPAAGQIASSCVERLP